MRKAEACDATLFGARSLAEDINETSRFDPGRPLSFGRRKRPARWRQMRTPGIRVPGMMFGLFNEAQSEYVGGVERGHTTSTLKLQEAIATGCDAAQQRIGPDK